MSELRQLGNQVGLSDRRRGGTGNQAERILGEFGTRLDNIGNTALRRSRLEPHSNLTDQFGMRVSSKADLGHAVSVRSTADCAPSEQGAERSTELVDEDVGYLPRGEVTSGVEFVPVPNVEIPTGRPAP